MLASSAVARLGAVTLLVCCCSTPPPATDGPRPVDQPRMEGLVMGDRPAAREANPVDEQFGQAASVARTYKRLYGGVDYSVFFDQGFVDTCLQESTLSSGMGCQALARAISSAAIAHGFLYRLDGDAADLQKATYLTTKLAEHYEVWKSTPKTWVLNAIAVYNLGLAAWLIWDSLDSSLRQALRAILVQEADYHLSLKPFTGTLGYDTKAEENVSVPGLLTMAAAFFPEQPTRDKWEKQAACFAYHAVTVGADEPYCGVRTITAFDNADSVAVFRPTAASFYLDYDGDQLWGNPQGAKIKVPTATAFQEEDEDRTFKYGLSTDLPVTGDWNGDGLSEIGVHRQSSSTFLLDLDGNGQWDVASDLSIPFGLPTDRAVIGDWNGDGTDEIGVVRIDTGGGATFLLDANGNRNWDGAPLDKIAPLGKSGDLPIAGRWNKQARDCIGVYRPSSKQVMLDWDCDFAWDLSKDKAVVFDPVTTGNVVAVAGDWNDDGADSVGLYDADAGRFYLDWDDSHVWEPDRDMTFVFGKSGDVPITGRWLQRKKLWMANHYIRPHIAYMAAEPLVLLDSWLVSSKAGKPLAPEFAHNIISLWNRLKDYLNPSNFSWTIKDDWNSTGLTRSVGAATYLCKALQTDCDIEKGLLHYKATDAKASAIIERDVPVQTQFQYTTEFVLNSYGAKRYVVVALSHALSLLPALPLPMQR